MRTHGIPLIALQRSRGRTFAFILAIIVDALVMAVLGAVGGVARRRNRNPQWPPVLALALSICRPCSRASSVASA
jgi:hypothetical protein